MSPDRAATFRPGPLAPGSGLHDDDRRRAAGYAAGWAAGARAAAEGAAARERRRTEESERVEAQRDAAVTQALATLGQATATIAAQRAPVLAELTGVLHSAAVELAEAVLQRELEPGPRSARSVLERALSLPADAGLHTVRVSPVDLVHVDAVLQAGELSLPPGARLVADPALMAGDVVSEHAVVVLDGQVRSAIGRIRQMLEGEG